MSETPTFNSSENQASSQTIFKDAGDAPQLSFQEQKQVEKTRHRREMGMIKYEQSEKRRATNQEKIASVKGKASELAGGIGKFLSGVKEKMGQVGESFLNRLNDVSEDVAEKAVSIKEKAGAGIKNSLETHRLKREQKKADRAEKKEQKLTAREARRQEREVSQAHAEGLKMNRRYDSLTSRAVSREQAEVDRIWKTLEYRQQAEVAFAENQRALELAEQNKKEIAKNPDAEYVLKVTQVISEQQQRLQGESREQQAEIDNITSLYQEQLARSQRNTEKYQARIAKITGLRSSLGMETSQETDSPIISLAENNDGSQVPLEKNGADSEKTFIPEELNAA